MKYAIAHTARALMLAACFALLVVQLPLSASQNTLQMPTTGTVSGLQFSNDVTDALDSLATCNAGSSAPANASGGSAKAGQCWIDTTSATLLKKYRYTGAAWVLEGVLDVTNGIWSPPIGGGTATVASATTTSICGSSAPQGYIVISGTTTITSLGTGCSAGQVKVLLFSGALTLTQNATSLILPAGANITTAAGDTAIAVSEGSGNWRIALYSPATGQAVANPAVPVGTKLDFFGGSVPTKYVLGYGQALDRSSYPDWLAAATIAQTGTRTSGSAVVTGLTSTARMGAGMPVEGTGIPSSTTISSVDSATQITLSANATTSGSSTVTVFLYGYGSGGDTTKVGVPDCQGRVVAGRDDMSGTAQNRLTSAGSGIVGTALGAAGGAQTVTLAQGNLPNVDFTVTIPSGQGSHTHTVQVGDSGGNSALIGSGASSAQSQKGGLIANATLPAMSGTAASGGSGTAVNKVQPTLVADCIIRVTP